MATRRTLQRQFFSPSYSPSASAEAGMFEQQASGMTQLANSLNQMSNFFYKEMETRAVEEGEMYGAANPITIEELQKAIKTGEDVTDRLGYGLKGRAARSTAFGNVMTEIELQASRDYVTFIDQAKQNDQSYEEVMDGLDAITVGYTDMLKGVSPENHIIMKGALSKLSSGHLKSYLSDMAEKQQQINESTVAAQLINSEQNIPTLVESILDDFKSEDQMAQELLESRKLQTNLSLNTAISKGGYTGPQVISLRKDQDKAYLDTYKSKITSIALRTGTVANYTSNITQGKKTGNAKIDAMLRQFTPEDRLDLVKDMMQARKDQISFAEAIDNSDDEKADELFITATIQANNALDEGNFSEFEKQIAIMRNIKPSDNKVVTLENDRKNLMGKRRISNASTFENLKSKAQKNILDFPELNENIDKLSRQDYDSLFKEIEEDKDNQIKIALSQVVQLREFNPLAENDPNTKESRLYAKLLGGIKEAKRNAQILQRAFDPNAWLQENVNKQNKEIVTNIKQEKQTNFQINYQLYISTMKTLKINTDNFGEYSLENYRNLLTLLNSASKGKIKQVRDNFTSSKGINASALLLELNEYTKEYGNE
tara:strand:- start:1510 stop:3306 length:1797 start_codon:yes stop_codon:yes gene_type:complete